MARAAVPGRLSSPAGWRVARLVERRDETASARTLVLRVADWPGHLPGQHVDVRLTAEDGYQTEREYSLAAPVSGDARRPRPADGPDLGGSALIELTVQQLPDGEVSPYLCEGLGQDEPIEVRGPVGGWFVWHPADTAPVLLVAGGSGIVPLMAMVRARAAAGSQTPFRLIYSVRSERDAFYADELRRQGRDDPDLGVTFVYTRQTPPGWPTPPHRIGPDDLTVHGWPAEAEPICFVCGPTGFVETVADLLVAVGHQPGRVKTERFGPVG